MVKLIKLVLSFLFCVFYLLPISLLASDGRAVMQAVSVSIREAPLVFNCASEKGLTGTEVLARLMPAETGGEYKKTLSAILRGVDDSDKTEADALVSGSENPMKASRLEFFAGTSLMNLGYTEFDSNGAWYDDEIGPLPGFLLGGMLYWPDNWYASLQLNAYFGDVAYRGQTQSFESPALSGLSINSRSDAGIFDTTAIAGYRFSTISLYGGVGYYFWRRNIRPTTLNNGLQVAGLLEFYSWSYALLGVNAPLVGVGASRISLDVRATRMLQANMEVNFLGYGGYDNARLNLGEDWGLHLALPWTFPSFAHGPTIIIEPWYTRWDLKRSNAVELTANGAYTGSAVHEPRSETRNFGISVYFRFLM